MILRAFLLVCWIPALVQGTVKFNRASGLYPSFDDVLNVPPDTMDEDDAQGGVFNVDFATLAGETVNFFGVDISHFRIYDNGFIECGTAPMTRTIGDVSALPTAVAATGTALTTGFCMVAPFIMTLDLAKYHVAYRVSKSNEAHSKHDTSRATAEVNRAKHQFHTTWTCSAALIVTWKIENAAGDLNKFQAIIAVGGGESYVMFRYQDPLPIAGYGVQAFVNGLYDDAAAPTFARGCSPLGAADTTVPASKEELVAQTNYRCSGDKGLLLLPISDDTCDTATMCTTHNANCNVTALPVDTCTETYWCTETDGDITLKIYLQWYQMETLQFLDQGKYAANKEQDLQSDPLGGSDACKLSLAAPINEETSKSTVTLELPDKIPACGTSVDEATTTVSFAFKVWDGDDRYTNIDQSKDLIAIGECNWSDFNLKPSENIVFHTPPAPTAMPPRVRVLKLEAVDRPSGVGAHVITTASEGREFYLLMTYEPGTPFNLWADPFGWYVKDCWASNNAEFENVAGSKVSELFIDNGCIVDANTLSAISTAASFVADQTGGLAPNPPNGGNWYQWAGSIIAAKWTFLNGANTAPVDDVYFKCVVHPCTLPEDRDSCMDYCATQKRKRRSAYNQPDVETLYTKVTITDRKAEKVTEDECTTLKTTVTTLSVLLALLVAAVVLCILIMVKWIAVRNATRKRSSMKKVST